MDIGHLLLKWKIPPDIMVNKSLFLFLFVYLFVVVSFYCNTLDEPLAVGGMGRVRKI